VSLNWKEIDLILSELDLPGSQIQKVIQSTFDVLCLKIHGKGKSRDILVALSPRACRLHETFRPIPRNDKPLRFAEFLNSRIVNGWIEEAVQLGDNRIIRLVVRLGERRFRLYLRLWSNAANFIVTDEQGLILDAMRRLPKRAEVSGGSYAPEASLAEGSGGKERVVRELAGPGSFNQRIDAWYAEQGGALSLEALREQAKRVFEGSIGRLQAALERLRLKEADYASADRLREYGDIILANVSSINTGSKGKGGGAGDEWLEALNFYADPPETIRIRLDPRKEPGAQAELYYEQYRKAKNGLGDLRVEIAEEEGELLKLEETLNRLLAETNPLVLHKLLRRGALPSRAQHLDEKRPGLTFRRGDWLIFVGRDAAENDELLRHHVKGNDLWLHARDYPGSYVFIKYRAGKTYPLEVLLDAGNLALFYSKGRRNGEGDLFYTQVKFLRRAKGGPKGLVLPSQEKNLHIVLDEQRIFSFFTSPPGFFTSPPGPLPRAERV
jgi:predicted ribosome quality control (RQC) complex YloA/Tae2 family protein